MVELLTEEEPSADGIPVEPLNISLCWYRFFSNARLLRTDGLEGTEDAVVGEVVLLVIWLCGKGNDVWDM